MDNIQYNKIVNNLIDIPTEPYLIPTYIYIEREWSCTAMAHMGHNEYIANKKD